MIARIWHGYTTPANAEAYETLLRNEIFPGIAARNAEGYRGITLLRRELDEEVEFATVMSFSCLDDVKAFVGADYERAYVPPRARALLKRFDATSQHYEVREQIDY